MKKTLLLVSYFFFMAGRVQAADRTVAFELYSWQQGPSWYFSVLEGTSTVRPLVDIKAKKTRLKGPEMLKGRLATLPVGQMLHWRVNPRNGLVLPPKETVFDIARFCQTTQIPLLLPNETSPPSE